MSFSQQLENLVAKSFLDYQGLSYGEVVAFNDSDYTVDIQIMKFRNSRGQTGVTPVNYPIIYKVPILAGGGNGNSISVSYESGDIVAVIHGVSEIRPDGENSSDRSKFLSKDNAVVLGKLVTENPFSGGNLQLGSNTVNMEIQSNAIVFTVGTTTFTINAAGATVSVGGVSVNLFTHLHGTAVGPSTPPTPGT